MALIETLKDNFDDGQRDISLWNSRAALEQLGYLYLLTSGGTGVQFSYYESVNSYDVTSSAAFVQMVSVDTSNTQLTVYPIMLTKDGGQSYIQYSIAIPPSGINLITAEYRISGSAAVTVRSNVVYDPAVHKWFKIRESAGTIYWDYSTDGSTWTNYTSVANPFAVTALKLQIQLRDLSPDSYASQALFDNFNIAPTSDPSTANPRQITQSTLISWKKDFAAGITAFTIGTSLIGGRDIIGSPTEQVYAAWSKYKYFDESPYVLALAWERRLQMPLGGLSIAAAHIKLDNTSGRFLPDYMHGNSELYTAILPRRPIIINAGFHYSGIDNNYPAFVGVLDKSPQIDVKNRQLDLSALDFMSYLDNKRADNATVYTGQRFDQIFDDILHNKLGIATSQYELDQGTQVYAYAGIEANDKWSNLINSLAQSELAHIFQDESGKIKFWNKYKWNLAPYNFNSTIIYTADVLEAGSPDEDHIINVVNVSSTPYTKATGNLYTLATAVTLQTGNNEVWIDFTNPVIAVTSQSYTANSSSDGTGTNDTGSVSIKNSSIFNRTAKYTFTNSTGRVSYLTVFTVTGRYASPGTTINRHYEDDSSVTAYEEHILSVDNNYIQTENDASNYANYILSQLSEPENIITLTIRAKPTLKNGDLISWQGQSWRIYAIEAKIDSSAGYLQDLTLVKRTVVDYFTIGISLIGGLSLIAP